MLILQLKRFVARSLWKYKQYHQDPRNEKVHLIGIPLMVIGLIIAMPLWLTLVLLLIYMVLAFRDFPVLLLLSVCAIPFINFSWYIGLALFSGSFLVQVISHKVFEGGYPAFFKHPEHVWVAPIWWCRKINNSPSPPR